MTGARTASSRTPDADLRLRTARQAATWVLGAVTALLTAAVATLLYAVDQMSARSGLEWQEGVVLVLRVLPAVGVAWVLGVRVADRWSRTHTSRPRLTGVLAALAGILAGVPVLWLAFEV